MSKLFSPKIAILIFIIIAIILPFYESKKILRWGIQGEQQKKNLFHFLVLSYAKESEKLKEKLGLANFFDKEDSFWNKLKESPLVFQPNIIEKPDEEITTGEKNKKGEEKKEQVIEDEKEISKKLETPPKIYSSYRFLIIGDSFIAVWGGLGEILEKKLLNYNDVFVKRFGQVSSGLSRPDYFNWELEATELISQYNPNIAIVMLSSNDAQSILTPHGNLVANYGEANWNQEYAKRVSNLLDIFEKNNIIVFWIGFPVMKNQAFSNRIGNLNLIYQKESQKGENVYFFSTREYLTDENKNYVSYLPDEQGIYRAVRQADGIHFTYFGGRLVADQLIKKMEEIIKLELKVKTGP